MVTSFGSFKAATYGRGIYSIESARSPEPGCGSWSDPLSAVRIATRCPPLLPVHNLGTHVIHQLTSQYGHSVAHPPTRPGMGGCRATACSSNWPPGRPAGWSQFTAILDRRQWVVDERSANNTRSVGRHMSNAVDIVVSFNTDCFASQHGWVLRDALGPGAASLDGVARRATSVIPSASRNACFEFEVHRDQLSGYESLMADWSAVLLPFYSRHPGRPSWLHRSIRCGRPLHPVCMDNLTSGDAPDSMRTTTTRTPCLTTAPASRPVTP